MKLNGETMGGPVLHAWVLPRPQGVDLTFLLSPLPLGFHQRLRECGIVPPVPAVKIARDSQGRPLRDASGAAVTMVDIQAAEHVVQLERYHQRVAVLAISEALRADPQVEFETSSPTGDAAQDWRDFADARFRELEAAGFSSGDMVRLCREICRLSNLLDVDVKGAQAGFLSPAVRPER